MKKLTFIEKNDAIVRLKNPSHFDKDCELLRKVNPTSKLHNEIAKVNEFSISSLCGRVLLELLNFAPIEDVEVNRLPVNKASDEKPINPAEGSKPIPEEPTFSMNKLMKESRSVNFPTEELKKKASKSKKSTPA